mmetsp:Transcript_43717/g.126255  ORF Transcript_43717/g.126255 Transcript_43717/m.126255 type:complete len:331 (-) Transcript_43717:337-1329(-)
MSVHRTGIYVNESEVAKVRYFAGKVLPNTLNAQVTGDEDKVCLHVEAGVLHLSCKQHSRPHLLGAPGRCEEQLVRQRALRRAIRIRILGPAATVGLPVQSRVGHAQMKRPAVSERGGDLMPQSLPHLPQRHGLFDQHLIDHLLRIHCHGTQIREEGARNILLAVANQEWRAIHLSGLLHGRQQLSECHPAGLVAGKPLLYMALGRLRNGHCHAKPWTVGLDDALHQHSECQRGIYAGTALVLPATLLNHSCCRSLEGDHPLEVAACDPGGRETLQFPDKPTATTQRLLAILPAGVVVTKKLEGSLDWPLQAEWRIIPHSEFQDVLVRYLL